MSGISIDGWWDGVASAQANMARARWGLLSSSNCAADAPAPISYGTHRVGGNAVTASDAYTYSGQFDSSALLMINGIFINTVELAAVSVGVEAVTRFPNCDGCGS